jgi:xylulokinase
MGAPIYSLERIRAIGGGVRNDLWMQIYADVNGQKFSRLKAPQESTALGAAIMGGVGVGIWKDYEEATSKIGIEKTFEPDAAAHEVYQHLYPIYRKAYESISSTFSTLAEFNEKYSS